MSKAYDKHLREHIDSVICTYEWLKDHFGEKYGLDPNFSVEDHDKSSYYLTEYLAYDDFFNAPRKSLIIMDNYNRARAHHISNNPHHWEHWISLKDDPEDPEHINIQIRCNEIPLHYIFEMVADWLSFLWRANKLTETSRWYNANKDIMRLHPNTRQLVESIVNDISSMKGDIYVKERTFT